MPTRLPSLLSRFLTLALLGVSHAIVSSTAAATAWEFYRWHILAVMLVVATQALVIAGLLVQRRQRRKAEAAIAEADVTARKREEDLRDALSEIRTLRDRLEIDNTIIRDEVERGSELAGILGSSEVMQYVVSKVRHVAPTPSTVLLLGETGVGKSLVARAIHNLSPRSHRPLVTLDCAALPASLIESELFGHERGAFTGAHTRRIGRFEAANGGTLFLDEIGELPMDVQGKLLRAVQDGEFVRVGSNALLRTDVRLIVATNRQLGEEVRAGRFRQDLWYRLNVFPITLPPLRQRADDIPVLVKHFVETHCRKLGRSPLEVSKASMKVLQSHTWLGNVRELENVIERAVIVSRGRCLDIDDDDLSATELGSQLGSPASAAPARTTLKELERAHIVATLELVSWRVDGAGGAADVLGINASTLRSRMRKLGIRRPGRAPMVEVAH
jgi:transcriptional regulator with GAF, ATPase, and Fis domain